MPTSLAHYGPAGLSAAMLRFLDDARATAWEPRETVRTSLRDRPQQEQPSELSWWLASGSTYAEQVGLDVAAGLLHGCPDADMKLVLATAVADEAKHSTVFHEYARIVGGGIRERADAAGELSRDLWSLDDHTSRFMAHALAEGFAADEFHWFVHGLAQDGLGAIYRLVRRDETRHVALGMAYLTRGPGADRLRALPAELFLAGEQTILRHSDTDAIGTLVNRLLPDVSADRVARWMQSRHETRMKVLMSVRRDSDEIAARRRYTKSHP